MTLTDRLMLNCNTDLTFVSGAEDPAIAGQVTYWWPLGTGSGFDRTSLLELEGNPQRWENGLDHTFILDLGDMTDQVGNPLGLIGLLNTGRFIDVVLGDDSKVDYMELKVWVRQ